MKKLLTSALLLTVIFVNALPQDTIFLAEYAANLKKLAVSIGGKSYTFLFDSGGGVTMISPEIVNNLKKTPYSKIFGYRMSGQKLEILKCDSVTIEAGKLRLFQNTLGVFDIMSILPKNAPNLDGVICLKSFRDKIISIDLEHNIIILETDKSYLKKKAKMTLLKSRIASSVTGEELDIFLAAKHNNHLYWFLFDCGNNGPIFFSLQTANDWGLQRDTTDKWKLYPADIDLGTKSHITDLTISDIIYDGVLNYNYISKNVYMIDLIRNEVWRD